MSKERKKEYKNIGSAICMAIFSVLACLSFVYFCMLVTLVGPQGFFFLFLFAAIGCLVLAFLCFRQWRGKWKVPKKLIVTFWSLVGVGVLCFGILFGMILHGQSVGPEKEADYVIVLGAGLRGERPSLVLQHRINAAAQYLKENPDSEVVVSGGQGADELISEAEAMRRGLVSLGIDEKRIHVEDKSTSTQENLIFSQKFVPKDADVVVVTNKFHVFRACHIAKECGYTKVSGLGADNVIWLSPTNYIRECMAVFKDVVLPSPNLKYLLHICA